MSAYCMIEVIEEEEVVLVVRKRTRKLCVSHTYMLKQQGRITVPHVPTLLSSVKTSAPKKITGPYEAVMYLRLLQAVA